MNTSLVMTFSLLCRCLAQIENRFPLADASLQRLSDAGAASVLVGPDSGLRQFVPTATVGRVHLQFAAREPAPHRDGGISRIGLSGPVHHQSHPAAADGDRPEEPLLRLNHVSTRLIVNTINDCILSLRKQSQSENKMGKNKDKCWKAERRELG